MLLKAKFQGLTGFFFLMFGKLSCFSASLSCITRKQPNGGILSKSCSENMQRIYRKTPMPKCTHAKATLLKSLFDMGVLL